jgi:hypothetical protein
VPVYPPLREERTPKPNHARVGFKWIKVATPLFFLVNQASVTAVVVLQKWLCQPTPVACTLQGPAFHLRTFVLVLQSYAGLAVLEPMLGSATYPLVLRLLGARVHRTAYVNTTRLAGHNLIELERDSVLGTGAPVYPHAVEGRALTVGPVRVAPGARLGAESTSVRDTVVAEGAELAGAAFLPPTVVRPGLLCGWCRGFV